MFDYITYLAAQERTTDASRAALPNSPVRLDRETNSIRRRMSVAFRWLADRLDPIPEHRVPTTVQAPC